MPERLTVNVDMDGVLADFDGTLEAGLVQRYPEIVVPDRAIDFYLSHRTTDQDILRLIPQIKDVKGFFRNLVPVEGAIEGWHRIVELGWHARVLSSPLTSNPWCEAEKLEWLDHHLGPEAADEAVITKDKHRFGGVALIDDRPVIADADDASWVHVVFTQPYNQHVETDFRLNGWRDSQLPEVLARCAARIL